MADDNKRNALFSKLFGKDKPAPESEDSSTLDAILNAEEEETKAEPAETSGDEFADWFSESMNEGADAPADISDTIEELFGAEEEDYSDLLPEFLPEDAEDEPEPEPEPEQELAEPSEPSQSFENFEEESPEEIYEDSEPESEEAPAEEPAIDEETVTLLAALGYSEADAETIKKAPVRSEHPRAKTSDLTLAYGYEGHEYTSHSQTADIKSAYSRNRKQLLIRLFGTLLFVILTAIYDCFGKKFGGALDVTVYPVVNILMSLQILLLAAACSAKQLFAGLNGIVKSEPIFHSISAAAVVLTAIYDIIIAIAAPAAFTLYNFPAAVCLLLGVGHDYFVLEREIYVFDRLASWQSVATLERVDSAALASELGEARPGSERDRVGQAFRMKRGEFAENYFRHINRPHPSAGIINYFVILPVLALAIVVALITAASEHTFIEALNAFMVVILIAMPSAMLVSMSYPFFALVSKKLGSDAVLFSESDAGEYKEVNTVVFEEADLFDEGSLTINRISVCDKNRMQDVFDIMCGVSALYDRIGGRIAGAFKASTAEGDAPEDVKVQRVDDGGFVGIADGRQYVVGSDAYLTSLGIPVMRYYDDKYIASNPGGVVLHIAVDGAEVFKLYLTYRIPDNMLMVIGELGNTETRIIMRTVDPNINLDLISRLLSNSFSGELTLIRKEYSEASAPSVSERGDTVEGGILVNGESPEAIIEAVRGCRIFSMFSKLNFNLSLFLYGLGAILAVLLGVLGSLVGLSSLYVFLFQVFSAAPCFILVHLTLTK